MRNTSYISNKISTFFSPHKLIFGIGSANLVGREAKNLGGNRALIITDKQVVSTGLTEEVVSSLKTAGLEVNIFDQVQAEPPLQNVDAGALIAKQKGCDIIIGLGGGSSLDVAKGTSIMAKVEGSVLDYVGNDLVPHRGIPKILLPTTAGTGSEVTRVFVLTDEGERTKKVVYSDFVLADVAIVDPKLTISMPPNVTADTGIDALVHAIETYVSMNATPFSDILAIEAIQLIGDNLAKAYAKPDNLESRYNMSLAATIAGMAFASGGLGANHALAYALGSDYHLSHGRSNAVLLPFIVDYNRPGNPLRYARIAQALGVSIENKSAFEASKQLVEHLKTFLDFLGISTRLGTYGVSKNDIPMMVEETMKQSRLFAPNPRNLNADDILKIYNSAL